MEEAVVYLGMGCDSTRAIIKHLETPKRKRKFKIRAVVSAQIGDESILIKEQMEECLYPILADEKIRTIQIARKSSSLKDGYVVLDDTEYIATCFNPKQTLAKNKSIIERNLLSTEAMELFETLLNEAIWKIYRIRRITDLKYRSVQTVFIGSRTECTSKLEIEGRAKGKVLEYCKHGIPRVYEEDIEGESCVQFLVAAPGNPLDKERKCFKTVWDKRNGIYKQLDLFDEENSQGVYAAGKGELVLNSEVIKIPVLW